MIDNLQTLRAFAALNVVVFHIVGISAVYGQGVGFFSFLDGWGTNGVDIFFVISGFVMGYSQATNPKSWQSFLEGRLVRIVPIYWVVSTIMMGLYLANPDMFERFEMTTLFAVSSYFFFSTLFFDFPLVDVGWTLEWEMLFYGLFTCSIALASEKYAKPLLLGMMVALIVAFNMTLLLEFIFGLAAAHIYLKHRMSPKLALVSLCVGFVGLIGVEIIKLPFPLPRAIEWGVPAFFIVLGASGCKQLHARLPVYLGAASYSIYLVQVLTIPAFYKVSSKFFSAFQTDLLAVFCLVATTVFGCLFYSFVEVPILNFFRKRKLKISQQVT